MLKSMTGYGLGKCSFALGLITVEAKSLNYRYLEVIVRLPEEISHFEKKIKELIQQKISRGRVSIVVNIERKNGPDYHFKINKALAASYCKTLRNIKKDFDLQEAVSLTHILKCPDILIAEKKLHPDFKKWSKAKKAFEKAVEDLLMSRRTEGKFIFKDLNGRADSIEKHLLKIEKRLPAIISKQRSRYMKKMAVCEGHAPKTKNKENDFFPLAQSFDISEEITRIKAHVRTLKKTIQKESEAGKKLDFIAQELVRETNTIASKTQDYAVSNSVIEIKAEIEKIREQVQNVE